MDPDYLTILNKLNNLEYLYTANDELNKSSISNLREAIGQSSSSTNRIEELYSALEQNFKLSANMYSNILKYMYKDKFLVMNFPELKSIYLGKFISLSCTDLETYKDPASCRDQVYARFIISGTAVEDIYITSNTFMTVTFEAFDDEDSAKLYAELNKLN